MPSFWRRAVLSGLLAALPVVPAHAQRVHGDVLQPDGASPALGVVVVATRTDGTVAGRVLSRERGAFDLRLPAAGTYTFSALRIGYRPTVVPDVVVADTGVANVRIVLAGVALQLSAVAVRSSDVCGTSHDPQSQVVQVWTEARTALAAAALWSREQLDAEWITFHRELLVGSEAVRKQEVHTTRTTTTHAFKSWDAESLATRGYQVSAASGATYYAPDPDVLLSDLFVQTHCFHLEPTVERGSGLLGVGFTPQRSRGDRVEIEGTLWIDQASAELRKLEFSYVGLPDPADAAHPGGSVEFLRLPEGPWMVSRWQIRMPMVGTGMPSNETGSARTMLKTGGPTLVGVSTGGGIVSRVERRGQLMYAAQGSGIALQLTRADSEVTLADASVTLDGTDYLWHADSTGMVRAAPVLDGRYTALIATPEMRALDAPPVTRSVLIAVSRTRLDSATMPTAREIVRGACGADAVRDGLAALYGTVRDSAGRPAAGRAVTVSWMGSVGASRSRVLVAARTTIGTMADDAGAWHACEVPRGVALTVRSSGDDGAAVTEVSVPPTRWIMPVPLRTSASVAAVADTTVATLEVVVKDAAGTMLGTTALELTAWTGEQRKLTTDGRGRAFVTAFPPGLVKLRAKRSGYVVGDVMFRAAAGRNTVPVILGQATSPMLDTVRVAGNRRTSSRLDAFETRRARHEATASFTADDIAKRSPSEIADLLRSVIGLRLVDSAGVKLAELTRGFTLDRDANARVCVTRVVLDGVVMPVETGVNVIRPDEIMGMEVFTSAARTPVGMGVSAEETACGLIVIYSRSSRDR